MKDEKIWNKEKNISKDMKNMVNEIEEVFKNYNRIVFDIFDDYETESSNNYKFEIYMDREMLVSKMDMDKIESIIESYNNQGSSLSSMFVDLWKRQIVIFFGWEKVIRV